MPSTDDLPYDQFLIEQIAGDLLPEATQDQIVATGFLRNSMLNEEGGIDPEQFRMEAMFDRMDAIGKSDPGGDDPMRPMPHPQVRSVHSGRVLPDVRVPQQHARGVHRRLHADEQVSRDEILASITQIETHLQSETPDWPERMRVWEAETLTAEPEWTVLELEHQGDNSQRYYYLEDGSVLAQGYAPHTV